MAMQGTPFQRQPRLTQIALAVRPTNFVADMVAPYVAVPSEKFVYTKFNTDEAFAIPDTRVGRLSAANTVEFGAFDVTDSTDDHALANPIPNKDVKAVDGTNFDPLAVGAEETARQWQLAREQRVATLFQTLGNFNSTLRATLSGTSQWSDFAASDPVSAILTAFDSMLVRPNKGVIGRAVWTKLRTHPKVLAAILGNAGAGIGQAGAGVASLRAVADLFELDELVVGDSFYNTAKKGQTASMSRLWGKHATFFRAEGVTSAQGSTPTFAFTARWGEMFAGTYQDPSIGIEGATVVKVGAHVKELIAWQDAAYFFQNAVA